MVNTDFPEIFNAWLTSILRENISTEVCAFAFNLFEPAEVDSVTFGIELIGAEYFDIEDDDWACDEIWVPSRRQLFIPTAYSSNNWVTCLHKTKNLVNNYLQTSSDGSRILKSSKGVGVGFIGGDLKIVWQSK